jgi:hypothetical protein
MFFSIIMVLKLLGNQPTLEDKIVKLSPGTSAEKATEIADYVREFASEAGFTTDEDHDLILAVMFKESGFRLPQSQGAAGEWGMMQVIPGDGHIKAIAKQYKCSDKEQNARSRLVTMPNGTQTYHKLCNGDVPNIFSNGYVWPWKLGILLKHSARASIYIGINEMAFWRDEYDAKLKRLFWTDKRNIPVRAHWWWDKVKAGLGDRVWICHYNYGPRIATSPGALSYPLSLIKHINTMED